MATLKQNGPSTYHTDNNEGPANSKHSKACFISLYAATQDDNGPDAAEGQLLHLESQTWRCRIEDFASAELFRPSQLCFSDIDSYDLVTHCNCVLNGWSGGTISIPWRKCNGKI